MVKPMLNNVNWGQKEHDLLVVLDQKVSDLQIAVKNLSDGSVSKISLLEKDKADRKDVENIQKKINDDIETRIRALENSKSNYLVMSIIYAGIGATMIGLIFWHMFQQ